METLNRGIKVTWKNKWKETNQAACQSGIHLAQIHHPYGGKGIGYVNSSKFKLCPTGRPTRRPILRPTRRPTLHPTRRPTSRPTRRPTPLPTRPKAPICKGGKTEVWVGHHPYFETTVGTFSHSKLWVINSDTTEHKMLDDWKELLPHRVPVGYKGDKSCAKFFTIGSPAVGTRTR